MQIFSNNIANLRQVQRFIPENALTTVSSDCWVICAYENRYMDGGQSFQITVVVSMTLHSAGSICEARRTKAAVGTNREGLSDSGLELAAVLPSGGSGH